MTHTNGWINTFTGKRFYFDNPNADSICIEDIAHALAYTCRYNGHTRFFYSVAEHSMYVCEKIVEQLTAGDIAEEQLRKVALQALLHDASEAYIADISSPLKRSPEFEFYRSLEKNIQNAIDIKFNVDLSFCDLTKKIDTQMLGSEVLQLFRDIDPDWKIYLESIMNEKMPYIQCFRPADAEILFLRKFKTYEYASLPESV